MTTRDAVFVFVAALATAIATGLGALPFALRRYRAHAWLGPANGVASGVMLGASAGLLIEGVQRSGARTALGALVGGLFVYVAYAVVGLNDAPTLGNLRVADSRKALTIVGASTPPAAA
jgi:hypothetical protein